MHQAGRPSMLVPAQHLCRVRVDVERGQDRLQEADHGFEILVSGLDTLPLGESPEERDGVRLSAHADLRVSVQEVRRTLLMSSTKPSPPCPKCGAKAVERLMSRINTEWLPSDVAWDRVGRSWD